MDAALITARKGSTSIPNKNTMEIAGRPLVGYPLEAATEANTIDKVYTTTNGKVIKQIAKKWSSEVICRPENLYGDGGHGEVIKHGVEKIDEEKDLENVVVLLGNTTMVDPGLIDKAISLLRQRSDIDSTMSVWEAADDHPVRALKTTSDGYLESYDKSEKN